MVTLNLISLLFGKVCIAISTFFIFFCLDSTSLANPVKSNEKNSFVVILDAGHGGKDSGAVYRSGSTLLKEKTYTLKLAKLLTQELKKAEYAEALGKPIKVINTRSTDKFVSLESRAELAHLKKADLLVSLHLNAEPTTKARGFEIFILNNTEAKSDARVESIENRFSLKYAKNLDTSSLLLRNVMNDAIVDQSKNASELVSQSIQETFAVEKIGIENRGIKQALLYVLLDAQTPGMLAEVLFLSNPKDRAILQSSEKLSVLSRGLAKGILRYLATSE